MEYRLEETERRLREDCERIDDVLRALRPFVDEIEFHHQASPCLEEIMIAKRQVYVRLLSVLWDTRLKKD
jgi:hypothetical protein